MNSKIQNKRVNGVILALVITIAISWIGHGLLPIYIKRWVAAAILISYPIIISWLYYKCSLALKETKEAINQLTLIYTFGYKNKWWRKPSISPLVVITALILGSLAALDLGLAISFALGTSLAWVITAVLIRHWGKKYAIIAVAFIVVVFSSLLYTMHLAGSKKVFLIDDLSNNFHPRVLSYLKEAPQAILTADISGQQKDHLSLQQIENAYQNYWFINNYNTANGNRFLKKSSVVANFKKGSDYAFQFSDTMPVRYLTSEHGIVIAIIPILLLLVLVFFPLKGIGNDINTQTGRIGYNALSLYLLLYLIIFSVIPLLVNYNAFPFIGVSYLMFSPVDKTGIAVFLVTISCIIWLVRHDRYDRLTRSYAKNIFFGIASVALGATISILGIKYIFDKTITSEYNLNELVEAVSIQARIINEVIEEQYNNGEITETDSYHFFKAVNIPKNNYGDGVMSLAKKTVYQFITENKNKENPLNLLYAVRDGQMWKIEVNENFYIKSPLNLAPKVYYPNINAFNPIEDEQTNYNNTLYAQQSNVVAKRIWVNGKYRYIIPATNKRLYHYMLAENLKKQSTNCINTTFDVSLEHYLDSITQRTFSDSVVQASIVLVDGNFNLRAMAQNSIPNSSNSLQNLNPNLFSDETEFNLLLYRMDINNNKNAYKELLEQRALISTDKPGSTIKPFTYSNVISGFNAHWERLELAMNPWESSKKNDNSYYNYFAGRCVGEFIHDAKGNLAAEDFLSLSKNTYHGLITYLGSYNAQTLANSYLSDNQINNRGASAIIPVHTINDSTLFPYFTYNGRIYHFNKNPIPGIDAQTMFGDSTSLLSTGFSNNYHSLLKYDLRENRLEYYRSWQKNNLHDSILYENGRYIDFLLPQYSSYYEDLRKVNLGAADPNFYNGFRATMTGANIYNFSPAIICKMAIALFSLNNLGKISLIETEPIDTIHWSKNEIRSGGAYNNMNDLLDHYQSTIYTGMFKSNTYKSPDGNTVGTAYNIFHHTGIPFTYNSGVITYLNRNYYLYTKTGTADEDDDENGKSKRKNLLIVISNTNLHDRTLDISQFRAAKKIAIYFQIKHHYSAKWSASDNEWITNSINGILHSRSFYNYFILQDQPEQAQQ